MAIGRALRRLHHSDFPAEQIARTRPATVSVVVPARDEAANIAATVGHLVDLREAGVVDQVLVVDDSTDGTADIAADAGAEVHDQSALCAEYGPVDGKGDAMWRALSVCRGEIVCYLDAASPFACATGRLRPLRPARTAPAAPRSRRTRA